MPRKRITVTNTKEEVSAIRSTESNHPPSPEMQAYAERFRRFKEKHPYPEWAELYYGQNIIDEEFTPDELAVMTAAKRERRRTERNENKHSTPNSIRTTITAYGPLDRVRCFVGRLLQDVIGACIPMLPDAQTASSYGETWGECPEYGDVEVLSATSVVAGQLAEDVRPHIKSIDTNWVSRNTVTVAEHHNKIAALDLPGFAGQGEAPVALISFNSKWNPLFGWIQAVINAEYESGVIVHMRSYDIMEDLACAAARSENPEDDFRREGCEHYHSYTSNGTEFIFSGHCAMLIQMEHARPYEEEENNAREQLKTDIMLHVPNEVQAAILHHAPEYWQDNELTFIETAVLDYIRDGLDDLSTAELRGRPKTISHCAARWCNSIWARPVSAGWRVARSLVLRP
jgi:hypothetical protein